MGLLRPDLNKVDPRYLLYIFLGPDFQETIRERTVHGSTVDRILLTEIGEFPVRLVAELAEQRSIAAFLGALDDKIELNRAMNRTLEDMAQAIFKSWFIDFDPINGTAPNGWASLSLGEACDRFGGDVQTGPFGSQLHASDYVASGVPSVMPRDLKEDRISTEGIARIRLEDAERLSKYRLQQGDIVCSRRGDVERRALVTGRENGWLCGTGCLRLRIDSYAVDSQYLYRYLGLDAVRGWIVQHAQGATMPNLNTKILRSLPLHIPPREVQDELRQKIGPLFERREHNHAESQTLAELRDTLLPRLISGEIRIPEAEEAVEHAL